MTKEKFGKIVLRHSLCWGWAFATPPIVMVILDLLERHTPTSVAIFSSMPFIFSNAFLTKELTRLVEPEEPTS